MIHEFKDEENGKFFSNDRFVDDGFCALDGEFKISKLVELIDLCEIEY